MRTFRALTTSTRAVAILALAAVLVVATAVAAVAQDDEESALGGKLRAGEEVLVPADAIVEGDLYATGGLVRVEGTVDGDLLASAGQVQITGTVTGDVMAGGGTISIDGDVDGDVRMAGGRIAVAGAIGEDLFVAGGQVRLASSGEVGEDLVFGTGQMTLAGTVTGDVLGTAGAYDNTGTIGGTERVTIQQPEDTGPPTLAERALDTLGRLASVLLIAALLLWLAPRLVEGPARTLRERLPMSLLIGVAGLVAVAIGIPITILIAAVLGVALAFIGLGDLVGLIVLGVLGIVVLIALALVLALAFIAPAVVGIALGDLLIPAATAHRRWWGLFVGVLVVVVASAVPVVGGWIAFLVAVVGLGAVLLALAPRDRTPAAEGASEGPEPAPAA